MTMTQKVTVEVEQVKRMAELIDDAVSQDLLRSYLREVEYDVTYCADDDGGKVTI